MTVITDNSIRRLEQITIEDKYNREQVRDFIIKEFRESRTTCEEIDLMILEASQAISTYLNTTYSYNSKNERIAYLKNKDLFSVEILVKEIMYLSLANPERTRIQKFAGKLAHILNYENIWDGIKTASELLVIVGEAIDFYTVYLASDPDSETGSIEIECNFNIDKSLEQTINDLQYIPPLICKPNKVRNNHQNGYLSVKKGLILGKDNIHNYPQNYDLINTINSIPLALDEYMLQYEEESKKPLDTLQKEKMFKLMKNSSRKIYELMLEKGNEFYFDWKYDSRGRFYSSGYNINIQSTEYKKAIINLANKQVIQIS